MKFLEYVIGQNVAYYEFCPKIAATVWTTTPHYVRISWNILHWKQHQKSCSPNPYPTCVLTNPNFPVPCIPTQWSLCSTECNSSSDKADQSLLNPLHSSPFTTVKYLLPLGCFLNGFVPINFPAKSIPPSRAKSALLHA